jgi:hypothetical protein
LRVVQVRAQVAAQQIPDGYEPLGLVAFALRMGVSRGTARKRMLEIAGRQDDPRQLRVMLLPVRIGSGARRLALHVLWPTSNTVAAA